eukprot:sb/3473812/
MHREFGLTIYRSQPIRTQYLGHVTGYQPIRDQYVLIRSVPDNIITVLCADHAGSRRVVGSYYGRYLPIARLDPALTSSIDHFFSSDLGLGEMDVSLVRSMMKSHLVSKTNQNSLFRSRDWLSANQGPHFLIRSVPAGFQNNSTIPS